jgi:hypothetical protein
MTDKKKKRKDVTPIDTLLLYTVDMAKIAWRNKQRSIEAAALKPSFRMVSGNIQPEMIVLEPLHAEAWQHATYMLRSYLITLLQEVGMYAEASALASLERSSLE